MSGRPNSEPGDPRQNPQTVPQSMRSPSKTEEEERRTDLVVWREPAPATNSMLVDSQDAPTLEGAGRWRFYAICCFTLILGLCFVYAGVLICVDELFDKPVRIKLDKQQKDEERSARMEDLDLQIQMLRQIRGELGESLTTWTNSSGRSAFFSDERFNGRYWARRIQNAVALQQESIEGLDGRLKCLRQTRTAGSFSRDAEALRVELDGELAKVRQAAIDVRNCQSAYANYLSVQGVGGAKR